MECVKKYVAVSIEDEQKYINDKAGQCNKKSSMFMKMQNMTE